MSEKKNISKKELIKLKKELEAALASINSVLNPEPKKDSPELPKIY